MIFYYSSKLSAAGISHSATTVVGAGFIKQTEGNLWTLVVSALPPWISPVGFHKVSILCPLLFLLYANDRVTASDAHCKLFLYADNSILAV